MSNKPFSMGFRVVFYREHDRIIAHALEFDLIGDGENREEALKRLSTAITIQVEFAMQSSDPATVLFRQAPPEIMAMFASGHALVEGVLKISVEEDGWQFSGEEFRDADVEDHELACV